MLITNTSGGELKPCALVVRHIEPDQLANETLAEDLEAAMLAIAELRLAREAS